jgi:chorismate mutase
MRMTAMTALTAADKPETDSDSQATATTHIAELRERIDAIDASIISLWLERAALSKEVGATRVASGGTRLVLARENKILDRFCEELALLILRAGRGPL